MFLKNRNISIKIKRSKVTDYAALTFCILMDFPIHINTIRMGLSIIYEPRHAIMCLREINYVMRNDIVKSDVIILRRAFTIKESVIKDYDNLDKSGLE